MTGSKKWLGFAALTVLLAGCSSNLNRFDVIQTDSSSKNQITRGEVADQGSGSTSSVNGPGGHSMMRVTIGGSYLRRNDSKNDNNISVSAGLFGNPRAKQ